MQVCVYASSSNALAPEYIAAAAELGRLMAQQGHTLIYGGGNIGLMGVLARAVHAHGGRVVGVIPEKLRDLELAYTQADELIITQTMRERKLEMEQRAGAFIALPGGLGTLEEVMEILVLRQLEYIQKPLVFLNTCGIFTPLFQLFDRLVAEQFMKPDHARLYAIANTPEEVLEALKKPMTQPEGKWFA